VNDLLHIALVVGQVQQMVLVNISVGVFLQDFIENDWEMVFLLGAVGIGRSR